MEREVEITPEMVEAGVAFCVAHDVQGIVSLREFVAELFSRMALVCPRTE